METLIPFFVLMASYAMHSLKCTLEISQNTGEKPSAATAKLSVQRDNAY